MKNIIKLFSIILILAFATSCDVDQVGPKYIDGDRGVTFDNAKYTTIIEPVVVEIKVHVSRVSAIKDETIGITHNCTNPEIFTIPQTVSFAKGEFEKDITIPVVTSAMDASLTYTFNLKLEEVASIGGVRETAISVSLKLNWIPAGVAIFNSQSWAGTIETIPVERAEGTNMYRIVSAYFYLEPDYCPNEGYHIVFEVDNNFDAVAQYPSFIGEYDGDDEIWIISTGYSGAGKTGEFRNVGNVYTIDGFFAYGPDGDHLSLGWYAVEVFEWIR